MATIVVPFRSPDAKRRLAPLSAEARADLAHAMLADVLAACVPVGRTLVVTAPDGARARAVAAAAGAEVLDDPGRGLADAVAVGLRAVTDGPALVVNADLPCARPADVLALLGLLPPGGLALVEAPDGTTNALALASPRLWEPLYGPGSAARFARHAEGIGVPWMAAPLPDLVDDVDTLADAELLADRLGPHSAAVLAALRAIAAA
ncbi:MAG: NTP transferase domain-containing protein [Thermoleophilia bacterium]|nr:NTP transferase domain-containing protein [Thermoleophilia bacterium]